MTYKEWMQQGKELFGENVENWKFVCPACGYVQSVRECRDAKVPEESIAFSCIGRWKDKAREAFSNEGAGPCDYAGGGLFRLNPIEVATPNGKTHHLFAFATSKTDGKEMGTRTE